jgi:hypothetical protein
VFSAWSMPRSYFENNWRYSSAVVGYSPDTNDVSTEGQESPLLEAVTTKRLVETVRD